MLLSSYTKEFVRPECRPEAQSVHLVAHLDQDISEVIPFSMLRLVVFSTSRTLLPFPSGYMESSLRSIREKFA